jgi:flagellar biosynthesis protein FlhF
MTYTTYRTESVQDALRQARNDLGEHAIILSVRTVRARGVRGLLGGRAIEVTAAAGRHQVSARRHAGEPTLMSDQARVEREVAELAARLEAGGVEVLLALEFARRHVAGGGGRGRSMGALTATLAEALSPLAAGGEDAAPVEMFVGPPGAGKTTTIAKIAAQERTRGGRAPILVSADGFRVGAVEQLRLYAAILSTPFVAARTPDEVVEAVRTSARPVLLDTAGRSPSDQASRELYHAMARRAGVRTHLVVAASSGREGLKAALGQFAEARPSRVVITKVDETGSLAPLLANLRDRGIPVSYLGTGQRVPDHLEVATGEVLAGWVTGEASERMERAA